MLLLAVGGTYGVGAVCAVKFGVVQEQVCDDEQAGLTQSPNSQARPAAQSLSVAQLKRHDGF